MEKQAENKGAQAVQDDVRKMIAERVHPPEEIVQTVGHPAQRLVGAHMESGEHPFKLRPAQPAEFLIRGDVFDIIPAHEPVLESGQEDEKSERGRGGGYQPVEPGRF